MSMATKCLPDRMRAWQLIKHGSRHGLQLNQSAKIPEIKRYDQLMVKVTASSINAIDMQMLQGYTGRVIENIKSRGKWPLTLGLDFCGEVVEVGKGVRAVQVGNKVWGSCMPYGTGTHADFTIAAQHEVALKPEFLSDIEAASIPNVAVTAWAALRRARLKEKNIANKKILILGGSGGVGTFCIQLIRAWGGSIVTTCNSDAVDLLESLGAKTVIDYRSKSAWNEIEKEGKFDVVIDLVGTDEEKALPLVRRHGKFVTLTVPLIQLIEDYSSIEGAIRTTKFLLRKFITENWNHSRGYSWVFAVGNGSILDKITSLMRNGKIKPVIEKVFSFDETDRAYTDFEAGHARGKIVIDATTKI